MGVSNPDCAGNFTFYEMSGLEFFRKYHEHKSNCPKLGLELFLLVRRLKSIARCSSRHGGFGDFLSLMEEAMSITLIVFVLIIVLFGFDSTRQVKNRRQRNRLREAS
jgi:hypothetical protein